MKDNLQNLEDKLKEFPSYSMSRSTQNLLHQQVMDALEDPDVQREGRGRGMFMNKLKIGFVTAAAITIMGILGISMLTNSPNSTSEGNPVENIKEPHLSTDQSPHDITPFTKEMALQVMQSYKNTFHSIKTDESGKIIHYQLKSEIENHFSKVMSADYAARMTETYIEEKNNTLFFRNLDAPTWLDEHMDFKIEEISNEHYKIIQDYNSYLKDHVEMIYHVVWQESKWVLSDVDVKNLDDPVLLEQKATEILHAIHDRNMDLLSSYVHSGKGLLLSPYYSVSDYTVVFEKNEIQTLLENETKYLWGYGEANTEIRLTPSAYLEQYLEVARFFNSDEVFVERQNQQVDSTNYLKEVFPDSKIVEFYHAGTEIYSGMDWRSVNLVFEQDVNGMWKLVAIVNNLFTP